MLTLHVDFRPDWRGGQNQALLLAGGLRARGHVAELLTVRDSPLARRALVSSFRVHTVGRTATRLAAAFRLRQLLAEKRFDLLHLHEAHVLTAAWLAGAHRRVPVVASRRSAYPLPAYQLALARYRAVHRVLAVSRFVADRLIASGVPSERIEVVYDGVEIPALPSSSARRLAREQWGVGASDTLFGCVGYLLPEKGQELLIRAWPAVREHFPTCHLLLAGDGPCRGQLMRLSRQLGVERAVRFTGFVEDVAQVYSALDGFLFPSLAEPLGSSLLAAMAHGLPVVALARGGVPEVVEDGRTGLLVPDPDAHAIAAAVTRLLTDAQLAAQLGARAREWIQWHFTTDHMVERTLDAYSRVCSGEGRREA